MKTKLIIFTMALMTGVLTSCVDTELCPEPADQHPHLASVSYGFDWSKTQDNPKNLPDSMYVVAYRVINQWKSSVMVNCLGPKNKPAQGKYINNAMVEPTVYPGQTKTDTIEYFKVKSGEYKFLCFNGSNEEIDYTSVDKFIYQKDVDMHDLYFNFKTYEKESPKLNRIIPKWTDYNNYTGYMQPAVRAVYYDTLTVRSLVANRTYHEVFTHPKRLTQRLTFEFDIQKDLSGGLFTVDSVFAEVSGIPFSVNLSNGYIDITKTSRMMFRAKLEVGANKDSLDNDNNKKVHCTAMIDVPTLISSEYDDVYHGPGIMQIMVCCSAENPADPTNRPPKKFQGLINLYHTIQDAKLVTYTQDRQHVKKAKDYATLTIKADMVVNGASILKSNDENDGLDSWVPQGGVIIDL